MSSDLKLPRSAFVFDKYFRLSDKIRSRINCIEYHITHLHLRPRNIVELVKAPAHQADRDLQVLRGLSSRLDINSIKYYTQCRDMFNRLYGNNTEDHMISLFGEYYRRESNNTDTLYKEFLENLKLSTQKARKHELIFRLACEARYRHHKGWYMVFNTLTVENEDDVFYKGSRVWTDYVRRVDNAVRIKLAGSVRKCKDKEVSTVFGVVERGTKKGRLHIHCLHFLKALPKGCVDPNYGKVIPSNREIHFFKQFWQHGFSVPIAVRYAMDDAYSKVGWRWPVDEEEQPVKASGPQALVFYLTKYITKSINFSEAQLPIMYIMPHRCIGMK